MKKPTIRQQLAKLHKEKAAFDAGKPARIGPPQRLNAHYSPPALDLEERRREFEAQQRKLNQQAEAPATAAVKRHITAVKEDRARKAKERAQIEGPRKEHNARIAALKKEHEAYLAPGVRAKKEQMAMRAKLRGKQ